MKGTLSLLLASLAVLASHRNASAQIPPSIMTPDRVDTRIGRLEFKDGAPTVETAEKVRDTLDFTRALNVYNNSFRGASAYAIGKGFQSIGAEDNTIVIFSELMDAKSLFLTANADTVYFIGVLNLSKGPLVRRAAAGESRAPSTTCGSAGSSTAASRAPIAAPGQVPARAAGLRGPLPDGGFFVARSKTNRVLYAFRAFLVNDDPKPAVENIKKNLKIYPYTPGGYGTSIGTALEGKVRLGAEPGDSRDQVRRGHRKGVQHDSPERLRLLRDDQCERAAGAGDQLRRRARGPAGRHRHRQGQTVQPRCAHEEDPQRCRGRGQRRGPDAELALQVSHPDWAYYPGSKWGSMLWEGGAFFETPPPRVQGRHVPAVAATGARTLDSRTAFYYAYTMDSPGMIMRVPDIGSQYLMGFLDAAGNPFDGGKTYKVTLPKGIPARAFWSFTLYDNQSRSMLDTPQRYPRAGSQNYPSPAAKASADGSTTIYFGPTQPAGVRPRELDPDHARQGLVHAPAPLQSAPVVLRQELAPERDRAREVKPLPRIGFLKRRRFRRRFSLRLK